ncbi:hypothetical protein QOZ88_16210 [Blastococcus sp. BMG 814]|uniref:Uncharacterized protein n=1 Tax=Blastococcus carthaginiensis TaxID=3050034 RepID=A0ABT9IF19_9ACTN|nr:hypothetical protein [Blastococcus carthaginiensis]MDP5184178.1 hypothetical protein [Blastococcus carthaginiensis]
MNYFGTTFALGLVRNHCQTFDAARTLRDRAWDEMQRLEALLPVATSEDDVDAQIAQHDLHRSVAYTNASDELWLGLTSMTTAATNLFKLLWNSQKYPAEREVLRRLLGLAAVEPTLVRKVRNSFEHMDERLFKHLAEEDRLMGDDPRFGRMRMSWLVTDSPPEMRSAGTTTVYDRIYGLWRPTADTLTFWGETVDLQEVTSTVDDIAQAVPSALTQAAAMHHYRIL